MKILRIFIVALVLIGLVVLVITNWSWVFSKNVTGKVVDVERVTDPTAVFGVRSTPEQMYSYSILIQGDDGQLYTSSSEDRQWQVIKKGYCVEAQLFRYPPWNLEKGNTFFNARLKNVKICSGESSLPGAPQPEAQQPQNVPPQPQK